MFHSSSGATAQTQVYEEDIHGPGTAGQTQYVNVPDKAAQALDGAR